MHDIHSVSTGISCLNSVFGGWQTTTKKPCVQMPGRRTCRIHFHTESTLLSNVHGRPKERRIFGRFPGLVRVTCRLRYGAFLEWYWQVKTSNKKICPISTSSTINLNRTGLGSNPALRGDSPGINYVSTILFIYSILKISVSTSQKIQSMSIIRTSRLILYTEVMGIYCMNFIGRVTTTSGKNAVFLNIKTGGICNFRWALKG